MPERHGEPSVFKHVLYIIKENRTYDQVFGDIEKGEGDPSLCIFGREVTPNHHKLVEEFVLLDNFYCSGVLSADGHQWTNEAYVTDYLEKAFGGFPRSYPYPGGDAMAYAPAGFIWDNVLAHKKTLRVYGEFVSATITLERSEAGRRSPTFIDMLPRLHRRNTDLIDVSGTAGIKTLEPYLCPTAIGFPAHRARRPPRRPVHQRAQGIRKDGELPNFTIMLLPNDHTSGTRPGMPTPEAAVADNDLALAESSRRSATASSGRRRASSSCRTIRRPASTTSTATARWRWSSARTHAPQVVDSTNYNQTSMVRTMELILGLPPMNQFDSSATPMASCFTDTGRPDAVRGRAEQDSARSAQPADEPDQRSRASCTGQRNPRSSIWTTSTGPTKTCSTASCGTPAAAAMIPIHNGPLGLRIKSICELLWVPLALPVLIADHTVCCVSGPVCSLLALHFCDLETLHPNAPQGLSKKNTGGVSGTQNFKPRS